MSSTRDGRPMVWRPVLRAVLALTVGTVGVAALPSVAPAMAAGGTVRVLALGDSITSGLSGDASWRYYLWHALANAGADVNFVGSVHGLRDGLTPRYTAFDSDHEGHAGLRADEVAAQVTAWATAAAPDVVLVHLGSNDLGDGQTPASTADDIELVIQRLRAVNPSVRVLLAKIIPSTQAYGADVPDLNARIASLAGALTTATSPVAAVDQFTGFDTATMLRDTEHPNELGQRRMASRWREALAPLVGVGERPSALLAVTPVSGQPTADDRLMGDRLADLGFDVAIRAAAELTTADAADHDLVLVSETIASSAIGNKFRDVATPVVVWEPGIFDDMGLASAVGTVTDRTALTIRASGHRLAGGLTGTPTVTLSTTHQWATAGAGALVAASLPESAARAAVFGFDLGAPLIGGGVAAERRVGLFMTKTGPSSLTAGGLSLVDASVSWAVDATAPAPTTSVSLTSPTPSSTIEPGDSVVLAASVAGTEPIASVRFRIDGAVVAEDVAAPYQHSWSATAGQHEVIAEARESSGALLPSAPVVITVGTAAPLEASVQLVVGDPAALGVDDVAVRDRLVAAGYDVAIVDDNAITGAGASTADAVLISASTSSSTMGTRLVGAAVPVVVWERFVFDELKLTGASTADAGTVASQTSVTIGAPGHPLAAGLSGTPTTSTSTRYHWGRPGSGAAVVATLPGDSTRATIFAYETGASMVGRTAPARRVALFHDLPSKLRPNGWALFDAAVSWAIDG